MEDHEINAVIQELEGQRNMFAARSANLALELAKVRHELEDLKKEQSEWLKTQPKSSDKKPSQT